jgi:riboflavin synthase
MQLGDRIGGHLVQGHVDGVGIVKSITQKTNSWIIEIIVPTIFMKYLIPVGSITVDGISLTVASIRDNVIDVSIIPHTMANTTLSGVEAGTRVNLEFDLIGKYVETLLAHGREGREGSISREKLREWGYEGS